MESKSLRSSHRLLRILAAAFLIGLLGACSVERQPPSPLPVERVDILYSWLGMGGYRENFVILRATNGEYWMAGNYLVHPFKPGSTRRQLQRVPAQRVVALLEAMSDPSLSREEGLASLQSQLYDVGTMKQVRDAGARIGEKSHASASENRAELGRLVRATYAHPFVRTDDYPEIHVRLRMADRVLTADSDSQLPMMLPWQDSRGERWNPRVPQVLATLLPLDSRASQRISPRCMTDQLIGVAYREIIVGAPCTDSITLRATRE